MNFKIVFWALALALSATTALAQNGGGATASAETSTESVAQGNAQAVTPVNSAASFEAERKKNFYELFFSSSSFEDAKGSGTYGMSWTMYPWKIVPRLYAGIHFSPFGFNFGLNDLTCDVVRFGPSLGFYITPKILVSMPLDVMCTIYFDENDNEKTAWGISVSPAIYVGKKVGIFFGPQLSAGFSDGSDVTCGFRTGIYF